MTTDELVAYVRETGVRNVTLTGGEPLLQPGIDELITALGALGYRVEIETNGSVSLQPFASLSFRPCFTMDYKLPGSGMEQTMLPENFSLLRSRDAVKFVAGSRVHRFSLPIWLRFHFSFPAVFSVPSVYYSAVHFPADSNYNFHILP